MWRLPSPLPKLEIGEVHLCFAVCLSTANDLASALPLLTPNELERASRFATETLRRRYLQAHALLHTLLRAYLDTTHYEIDFLVKGKPFLRAPQQQPQLEFNMSHAGEYVAIALALGNPVGVDTEVIRPLADLEALIEECCTQGERAYLATLRSDARLVAFYRLWTRKEALLKMQGFGIGLKLSTVEVRATVEGITLLDLSLMDVATERMTNDVVGSLAFPELDEAPKLMLLNARWTDD